MSIEIRPRDRRALLGLGIALIVYVVLSEAAFPVWDGLEQAADVAAAKEDELRRYRRAIERQAEYRALEAEIQARLGPIEPRLIQAENSGLASSEVQSLVEGAAQRVGIDFLERNMAGPRALDEVVSEIGMTASFVCTVNQLVALLAEFRGGETLLSVRSLRVAPRELYEAPDVVPADRDWNKQLEVTLTVFALAANS